MCNDDTRNKTRNIKNTKNAYQNTNTRARPYATFACTRCEHARNMLNTLNDSLHMHIISGAYGVAYLCLLSGDRATVRRLFWALLCTTTTTPHTLSPCSAQHGRAETSARVRARLQQYRAMRAHHLTIFARLLQTAATVAVVDARSIQSIAMCTDSHTQTHRRAHMCQGAAHVHNKSERSRCCKKMHIWRCVGWRCMFQFTERTRCSVYLINVCMA